MKPFNLSLLNLFTAKLIEESLKGNRKAQLKLYNSYCDAMLTIAYRYVKDMDTAQDVTQEAFIKAFSNLRRYDGSSSFGAWLKQIVIHQSIDFLRKRTFDLCLDQVPNLSIENDDNWDVEEHLEVNHIKRAIDKLPEKYSVVLKLYLMEGYDHEEISEILEVSVNASRTQLHRGKNMLKEQLKMKGYEMSHNH
ncbi:RNA polymerase sigma factor [Psychroflexus sediminis]|uniref:RNA polymerase sigma factor n=1 Tax=Psychroflexus sediminis TaxID=470826 RepID=A0A1G7WTA1_9FLAO|nr:RNA polymerase sigma factor [Psychroflexus sediminis]SDG75177.1 RNA polymerase sigma-70 factor, ECF subfamily [Psychroflexus sediminis]